jgi:hypothetical protein
VGPKAGLHDMENFKFLTLLGLQLLLLGRSTSSQSLYRLRYRGSLYIYKGKALEAHRPIGRVGFMVVKVALG